MAIGILNSIWQIIENLFINNLSKTIMPTNVTFTDGYRQANFFVKELYIGSKWKQDLYPSRMILCQARNHIHADGYLISIGLEYEYDDHTGMKHGFLSVGNNSSNPIKFDPKGMFKGVDCYIVVDWSVFSLPVSQTDLLNGEICFGAVVDMEAATNINNSPTIKKYLFEQRIINLSLEDVPKCYFNKEEWYPIVSNHTVNISNWDDFVNAVNNYNSVTLNLTDDIAITDDRLKYETQDNPLTGLVTFGHSKKVIIKGNNKKLFDYTSPILGATLENGIFSVPYPYTVTGEETFVTLRGKMKTLAKSNVYKAQGWITPSNNNNVYGLLLPNELTHMYENPENLDNVFVCYRLSFYRYMRKITSITPNALYFEAVGNDDATCDPYFRDVLTPQTDFYLINYNGDNEGAVIKDGYLYYPVAYSTLSRCLWKNVIYARSTANVCLYELSVIGGVDNSIRNDAEMCLNKCDISHEAGGGVSNYKKLFAEGNTFHDIKGCALRMELLRYDENEDERPYMKVTNNTFKNIGHYGTNTSAVWSSAKAYIAYNEFIDTNYCAVRLGDNGNLLCKNWRRNLVEHNFIHYTSEWISRRKQLGLQDSGDIYVVGNNEKAIIRFNRIVGTGGLEGSSPYRKNNGIYIDYWAYNVQIYGNVITGTENYYDIDCRDCSPEQLPNNGQMQVLENGQYPTTNIFIGYNVCDGNLRIQENTVDVTNQDNGLVESGCNFVSNFVLGKTIEPEIENGVTTGNTYMDVEFCKDSEGIVTDEMGMVASNALIDLFENSPILPESEENDPS